MHKHLILDLYKAKNLTDVTVARQALIQAAKTCGATVLHEYFHVFEPYGGVTGVVCVSESHLSIHTWPEDRYAAIDIFLCGGLNPRRGILELIQTFEAQDYRIRTINRGLIHEHHRIYTGTGR